MTESTLTESTSTDESTVTESAENITLQSFSSDIVITLVIQISGILITYLLQVLLARWMGKTEYGIYEYVIVWVTLLALPAGLGLPLATVRLISQYKVTQDWGSLYGIFWGSSKLTFLGSFILISIAVAVILVVNHYHEFIYAIPLLIGILILPLQALVNLYQEIATALEKFALAYLPNEIIYPIFVLFGGFILWQNQHSLNSLSLLILTGVILLFVSIVQFFLVRNNLNQEFESMIPVYSYRQWVKLSLILLLQQSFALIMFKSDIVMVGSLIGPESAGIYNAAYKTVNWVDLSLVTFNIISAPKFATLYAKKNMLGLQNLINRVNILIFLPTMLVSLCFLTFTSPILSLFGSDFTTADGTLKVLVIGRIVNAFCGSVGLLMVMTGNQNKSVPVFGWCTLMNIILNSIGIALFGLIGAAIATTITTITWNIWLSVLVIKYIDVRPSVFNTLFKPKSKELVEIK